MFFLGLGRLGRERIQLLSGEGKMNATRDVTEEDIGFHITPLINFGMVLYLGAKSCFVISLLCFGGFLCVWAYDSTRTPRTHARYTRRFIHSSSSRRSISSTSDEVYHTRIRIHIYVQALFSFPHGQSGFRIRGEGGRCYIIQQYPLVRWGRGATYDRSLKLNS